MSQPIQHIGVLSRAAATLWEANPVYLATAVILMTGTIHWIFNKPKGQRHFPTWAALEIALSTYVFANAGVGQKLYKAMRRFDGALFGLTPVHQVIINLPDVDRFLSQSYHSLKAGPFQYTLVTRAFGGEDTPNFKMRFEKSWNELFRPMERMFLHESGAGTAIETANIPMRASSFVSFADDQEHCQRWEQAANIRLLCRNSSEAPGVVEADFLRLVRDFGACMAIPLLYGQDFLDRNQTLLDDFWNFDNDFFPLLVIGVPTWLPFKPIRDGVAGRGRLLLALEDLFRRIDQYQQNIPIDGNADMSDVCQTTLDRNIIFARDDWSYRERAVGEFPILFGENANTHPMIFWLLTYMHSTPGLVDSIRKEAGAFVRFSRSEGELLTIESIDVTALGHNCHLLRSCIYETYRLANEGTSIRYVTNPTTVKDGGRKHELKEGMYISVPHAATQTDPELYKNPETFKPDRFLQVDPESGKTSAQMGSLRPFGSGSAMCRGRKFAEKEILGLATAIVSLWDIKPASGKWELPVMVPGTGVKKPVKDLRVKISRRRL